MSELFWQAILARVPYWQIRWRAGPGPREGVDQEEPALGKHAFTLRDLQSDGTIVWEGRSVGRQMHSVLGNG